MITKEAAKEAALIVPNDFVALALIDANYVASSRVYELVGKLRHCCACRTAAPTI